MKTCLSSLTALLLLSSSQLSAENWPNWRGPNQDGSSSETNLPEKFSKTENVKWKTTLPGPGSSTAVIWDDHVFLTSANGETNSVGLALDRKTGKELWRKEFQGVGKDKRSNYAAPSAVTDGKTVTFFFGNGQIGVYDFQGNELWSGDIAERVGGFAFGWTFSSSPVLHGDKLYLQILQRDEPVEGRGLENAESFIWRLM
ncbi:MAG: PQQ-binding-like beta-propeller repeat protein [Verrucomicrobiota bacterium]